jgi:GNAT superfamily N-acetyltransferase
VNPRLQADEQLPLGDGNTVRLRTIGRDRGGTVAGDEGAEIAAIDADGRTVGRLLYARVYGPRAQVELEIDDAFWHRGLPQALLARICARAACIGISTFLVRVRAADVRLLALLRQDFAARESRHGEYVDVELSTAPRPTVAANYRA